MIESRPAKNEINVEGGQTGWEGQGGSSVRSSHADKAMQEHTTSREPRAALRSRTAGGLNIRTLMLGAAVVLVGVTAVWLAGGFTSSSGAVAQSSQRERGQDGNRGVPVEVAQAAKKKVPVRIESLGTVTPIASVAVKTRIDTEIVQVHFEDGAFVKQGDLLFTLDSRALQTQLKEKEGTLSAQPCCAGRRRARCAPLHRVDRQRRHHPAQSR